MTTALVLLLALAFILFLASLMRRRRVESDPASLYRQLQPLHLPALLRLLNAEDLSFLRTNLREPDFMKLKRQRTRALIDYVQRIASNAKVLTSIGILYRQSPLREAAAAGDSLVSCSLMTRILALRTLLGLQIQLILPIFTINVRSTVKAYEAAQARLEGTSSASLLSH